jgi:hypothetical protein
MKQSLPCKSLLKSELRLPLFALGTAICLSSAAQAQLISDESFLTGAGGYTVGSQLTAAPIPSPTVAGYTGNWTTVDFGTVHPTEQATSLVYGGAGYAAGTGGSISVPAYTGGIAAGNSGRMFRLLDSTTKVDSSTTGTRYLSFLYQSGQEHGATTFQMLDLYNTNTADANRTFTAGLTTNGGNTGNAYDFGVKESYTSTGVAANTAVHLWVVKFDLSSVSLGDSVTVWLDPTLGAGDPSGGFTTSGLDIAFDRLSISDYAAVGTNGGNSGAWDEIRFGSSFNSVTAVPEPHEFAIAIAALLGVMVFIRRRNQQA